MIIFTLHPEARIGSVWLKVADLDRSLAFYQGRLGFQLLEHNSDRALLGAGNTSLIGLRQPANPLPRSRRSTGLFHIAIRLPDRADLGRLLLNLMESGWPIQGGADHLVSEALYLADPDGNGIELYIDRPRQEWPMQGSQVEMSTEALDANGLARAARPASFYNGAIPPLTDIGHIHLQVSDLARAEAFYVEALGMQVMQRNFPGTLFVSAGGYHHHIGMNVWNSLHGSPGPADAVGLEAFSIALPDQAARQAALEHLSAAGVKTSPAPEALIGGGGLALSDPDQICLIV